MNAAASCCHYLTPPQQSIYNSIRFHGKSEIYNISATLTFARNFEPQILERSLNKLIEMNDALRIRLTGARSRPKQYIEPYRYEPIEIIDLSRCSPGQVQQALTQIGREPLFGFHKALFKFCLVNYGRHYGGYLKVSHLVADGLSLVLLATQLEEACRKIQTAETIVPKPSYIEFIERQQAYLSSGHYQHDEAYWNEELAATAATHLKDYLGDQAHNQTLEAAREKIFLAQDTTQRLHDFCAANQFTLFSLFVAAMGIYLARIGGREDVIIGTPILNRMTGERLTAGMFVSMLPLRIRIAPDEPFRHNVHSIHRQIIKMLRHARFPSEKALEIFRSRNHTANMPYDVAVSFQPTSFARTDNTLDYEADWWFNGYETNTLLVTIGDRDAKGRLVVEADYRFRLISRENVNRVMANIRALLTDGIAHPEKACSELELISEDEKDELVYKVNPGRNCTAPAWKTWPEWFEAQVARTPDNVAVVSDGVELRYAELNQKANQLARRLRELGVGQGTPVAIMVERSIEMLVGVLAILKAGGCYVPIEPAYPEQRIAFILADSKVRLLLLQRGDRAAPADVPSLCIDMAASALYAGPGDELPRLNTEEDLAYIMYTSGSTGTPKGVAVPHRSVVTRLLSMQRDFRLEAGDVFIFKTSFMFDVSITELFLPLVCGSRLIIPPPGAEREPDQLLRYLAEFGVTVINFVPSMLSVFLEFLARKPAHLPRLRYLCCAGEILSGNVIKRARNLLGSGVKIANQYGPTETSYASACPEVGNGDSVSIGRPMDHTVFYILDRHRRLLPRGVRGEMYIGGAGLACGYISNEALTCERFVASSFVPNETLYRTGDYGRWLADGNLEFLGREDSQVKIRGFRVELGEIERVLERNPAVNQAIALVKDGSLTGYLHCSEAVDIPVLRRWLSEMLPAWMIPTEFIFLERMPLTPNGKVDKAALLSLPDRAGKSSIAAQGLTTTESRLAQAWQDTLGNKPIGPEEDFFEVGGDSLKATSLALAIEDAFNVELPLGELYKFRTLREQALLVEQQRAKPREGVVLLRRGTKTERTIFFVHGGSGSIGGYVNLFRNPAVSLDEDVTAYAIRYDRMKTCAPIEESIESVALDYLARIRRVQREGPYNLAAWCIGAQLITELALLLEAERLDVARLIFFNSIAPREWENIEPFNLEREKRFGADLLGEEGPGRLSDVRSIQEVWERVLAYAEAHPGDVQSRLPADWLASIPDFRRLQIGEVLYFFNCMRGLHLARAAYRPRRKVRAQCYFVNPEKDRTIPIHLKEANIQAWSMYFEKPIKILCVRGDEHSVFDQDIDDTIQAINSALRS